MNPAISWYLARATGWVAWGLLTVAVISGLVLSTRLRRGRPTAAWVLDVHRLLAGTTLVFTGLHLVGLATDRYVHFSLVDLFVPFASSWRPGPVALGVVAFELLVAVEVSSLLGRRVSRPLWRKIHVVSFVAFWMATFHLLLAGTDVANPLARVVTVAALGLVVFLSLVRFLGGRGVGAAKDRAARTSGAAAGRSGAAGPRSAAGSPRDRAAARSPRPPTRTEEPVPAG